MKIACKLPADQFFRNVIMCSALLIMMTHQAFPQKVSGEQKKFKESNNSLEKKEILQSLENPSQEEMGLLDSLIEDALDEQSPTVVEEAILATGKFKRLSFENKLFKVYDEAGVKFGGYREIIQNACLRAFGKMHTQQCDDFLVNLLDKENGTITGELLLSIIKENGNPSYIGPLQKYQTKMEKIIDNARARGDDPMFYSRALIQSTMAKEICESLKNGEKK